MLSFVAAASIKRKLIILHFLPQGSVRSSVKCTAQHKLPNAMKVLGNAVQKKQRMSTGGRCVVVVVVSKEKSTYGDEGRRRCERLKQMEL